MFQAGVGGGGVAGVDVGCWWKRGLVGAVVLARGYCGNCDRVGDCLGRVESRY